MTLEQLFVEANRLAQVGMGTRKDTRGKTILLADEDPLACWCLTDAIVSLAYQYKYDKSYRGSLSENSNASV